MENEKSVAPPAKESRLKSFLLKHNRSLTFIGAFIVFTTFVVKEGIRENLKELKDSIGNAKNVFMIREDFYILHDRLKAIQLGMNVLSEGQRTASADGDEGLSTRTVIERGVVLKTITDDQVEMASLLDNLQELMGKVAVDAADLEGFRRRLDELMKLHYDIMISLQKAHREFLEGAQKEDGGRGELGQIDVGLVRLLEKDGELLFEVEPVVEKTLRSAVGEGEKKERFYKICTWASYLLYTIGWGLGLVGRVFSVKGLGSGE
jgi:hypothetical protein